LSGLTRALSRQLWFASHHAIHHFSLIRVRTSRPSTWLTDQMIAAAELHLSIADDFGYAPSTILKSQSTAESWPVGGALQAKL